MLYVILAVCVLYVGCGRCNNLGQYCSVWDDWNTRCQECGWCGGCGNTDYRDGMGMVDGDKFDWSHRPVGTYGITTFMDDAWDFQTDFKPGDVRHQIGSGQKPPWYTWGPTGLTSIVKDKERNKNVLEVLLKGNKCCYTEGVAFTKPIQCYENLHLSYFVRLPDQWDSALGGKLPGLAGSKGYCDKAGPGGGTVINGWNGFTANIMFKAQDTLALYVYHMHPPSSVCENGGNTCYGEIFYFKTNGGTGTKITFQGGKWYQLELQLQLNTPGQRNGLVRGWVDGVLAAEKTGLEFRADKRFSIDHFAFSNFYGGNDLSYAPSSDQRYRFDQFEISTSRIGKQPTPETFGQLSYTPGVEEDSGEGSSVPLWPFLVGGGGAGLVYLVFGAVVNIGGVCLILCCLVSVVSCLVLSCFGLGFCGGTVYATKKAVEGSQAGARELDDMEQEFKINEEGSVLEESLLHDFDQ